MPHAGQPRRLVPCQRLTPICLAGALARLARAPLDAFGADGRADLGVAVFAASRYLGAADPRIKSGVGPLDFSFVGHGIID